MTVFPFKRKSLETHNMRDKIVIIEALIFALPFLAILYIINRGNYNFDLLQVIMFMGIAIFILAGMIILRQILDRVSIIATSLKRAESGNAIPIDIQKDVVELHEISVSLNNLLHKLEQVKGELAQKSFALSTIKDLTEIIKGNLSIDDQLSILLEKCMAVTGAQIGSVFMLEPETRQQSLVVSKSAPMSLSTLYRFRIVAAKGPDEELKKGSLINIDSSVVKAALLERGPLLIRDISADPRTSKNNDAKYGTPSFLSMPIVTGDVVSAILNLACKEEGQLFDDNDERILSIILRDIGFALENTMLQSKIKGQLERIRGYDIELEREIADHERTERVLKYNNITERKRAEETLEESEKKYRFITEKMTDIVWIQDMNLRTVYVSPSIEATLGFTPEERLAQDVHEQLTPASMSVALGVMAKELALEQQGQADPERKIIIELEYYHKDGSTRWIENIISGIRDDKGVLTGLHGVSRDITRRKQVEEALRILAVRNEAILAAVPDIIMEVDSCKRYTWANEAGMRFFGEDVVDREASYYFEGDQETYNKVQPLFEGFDDVIYIESWQRRKDGEKRLLSWWCKVLKDKQGLVTGALSTGRDITELKQAEERLREQLHFLQQLLDAIPIPIFYKDRQGVFRGCNMAYEKFVGTTKEQVIGKTVFEIAPQDLANIYYRADEVLFTQQGTQVYETSFLHADGNRRDIIFNKATYVGTNGSVAGLVGVILDITERKQMEEEMVLISSIGTVIGSTLEIDTVYERVATEIARLIPFDSMIVNLSDTQQETLHCAYISGLDVPGRRVGDSFPVRGTLWEEVIRTKRGVIIQSEDPKDLVEKFPSLIVSVRAGMRSIMSVPLIARDEMIGCLIMRSQKTGAYTEQHLRLAERIGMQIAGAIANAQLFNDLSKTEKSLRESEGRFRGLVEQAAVGVAEIVMETGQFITVNKRLCEMVGRTEAELLATTFQAITHPEDAHLHEKKTALLAAGKIGHYNLEKRYLRKDGEIVWVNLTTSSLWKPGEKSGHNMIVVEDITERRRMEEVLRKSEEEQRLLIEMLPLAVFVETHGKIAFVNPAFLTLLKASSMDDVIGMRLIEFASPELYDTLEKGRRIMTEEKHILPPLEMNLRCMDGTFVTVVSTPMPIVFQDQPGILSVLYDITERKRNEIELQKANKLLEIHSKEIEDLHAKLNEQVTRDPLTGLFNRLYLEATIGRELARASREGFPIGIVMIDIDYFKQVNDTHGHKAGDLILQALGNLLLGRIRAGDIACRYGGDEFLLILPQASKAITAERAEQWRTDFEALRTVYGEKVLQTTISFGVAAYPLDGITTEAAIHAADQAMYRAKTLGRNRVVLA
jgi:diguanylate cyclase (GGDEF)-like protein/PAS domain S-box-containing protein